MAKFDANNLTDSELRSKLAEYGHPVGPVTETTRVILIKKLKILMKQKNSTRNSSRSLTRFSSGDESGSDTEQNGGHRNSRRISMPPPSGYKSTKRKSVPRNYTPDSPVPLLSNVSSSTPIKPSRINSDLKSSRYSSPMFSMEQPFYSAGIRPTASSTCDYDFDSGSYSKVPDFKNLSPTSRRKTGLTYGSLSSYRSRLSNSNSKNIPTTPSDLLSSRLKIESKKESRPFFSNFVGRFSCKSGLNDALNPLDIKESDVEEDEFTDKWRNVNIGSRSFNFRDRAKPIKSFFQYFKSKDNALSSNYKSRNNTQFFSKLLLAVFLLFFIWLALAYFRVSHRSGIGGRSINNYPLCNGLQTGDSCIPKEELAYAIRLYKEVHLELQARGLRSTCGPPLENGSFQKPEMAESEIVYFLSRTRRDIELESLKKGVKNLKLLVWANKHWGISLLRESENSDSSLVEYALSDKVAEDVKNNPHLFICRNLSIPWTCYIARLFYRIVLILFIIALGAALLYLFLVVWRYYKKVKKTENEQVMAMVEKILDFMYVRSQMKNMWNNTSDSVDKSNSAVDLNGSLTSTQDYVAIRHVHDTLIHPNERQKMARIWEKAVKFIEENESRIRTEVQQVWGEDTTVWRWLGPTMSKSQTSFHENSDSGNESANQLYPDLSSLKAEAKRSSDRVWQGEAFETSEGSMNSLPSSPTQCLKIRHMFKHDKDYGPDWVLKVKDAIVEKCEGAKIVHLSVDKESKEGCVYVKCASPQDAGVAYRQLHGSWFDGALVTVKYLRLERYHERFPDSAYARTPLRPSNNLRLSLQGTSS